LMHALVNSQEPELWVVPSQVVDDATASS